MSVMAVSAGVVSLRVTDLVEGEENSVRGTGLRFTVSFWDALGDLVLSGSAKLDLVFRRRGGGSGSDTIGLIGDGQGVWRATWDSSVARAGTVWWSARANDGTTNVVADGDFNLIANRANVPASDSP